ncbi:hypothetical protein SV13_01640, partial [Clostridium perfringens]
LILYNKLNKEDKKNIKKRIINNKKILINLKTKKTKVASNILNLLGIELTSKIFNYYHNRKRER